MKAPSIFKKLAAYLPKDKKLPRNIKISLAITSTLQVAATTVGAYIGIASATTIPGMIGLGALGFVAGNLAGGLVGGIAFAALIAFNVRKEKKAAAKKMPVASAPALANGAPKLPTGQLKAGFNAANQNLKTKAAAVIPKLKHTLRFGR